MSFFGGGGGVILKTAEYLVTPADLVNTIVLGPITCDLLNGSVDIDNSELYDGDLTLQVQYIDGTWHDSVDLSTIRLALFLGAFNGSGFGNILNNSNIKIPVVFRVKITLQATAGSLDIKVRYL